MVPRLLQALGKRCLLLPYFEGPLMMLLLLHEHAAPTQDVVACISKVDTSRASPQRATWQIADGGMLPNDLVGC